MNGKKSISVSIIPPGAYPVLKGAAAMGLLHALRDPKVGAAAGQIIASKAGEMRAVVMRHIERVEDAANRLGPEAVYAQAHEIRGLAGNAGLEATGRIANVLCRYLDGIMRAGRQPERGLMLLHLDAIARAANAEDEATRLGDTVANELSQLVDRKLAEINESSTTS